jgi:hypothetical protein
MLVRGQITQAEETAAGQEDRKQHSAQHPRRRCAQGDVGRSEHGNERPHWLPGAGPVGAGRTGPQA